MTLKEKFKEFDRIAPVEMAMISGKEFSYRRYKNPDAKRTLLCFSSPPGPALGMASFIYMTYSHRTIASCLLITRWDFLPSLAKSMQLPRS